MGFNPDVEAAHVIKWARDYLAGTEGKPLVIGISGGKDSTITAAALAEIVALAGKPLALGPDLRELVLRAQIDGAEALAFSLEAGESPLDGLRLRQRVARPDAGDSL